MTYTLETMLGTFLRACERRAILKYGVGNAARKNEWVQQEQERVIMGNLSNQILILEKYQVVNSFQTLKMHQMLLQPWLSIQPAFIEQRLCVSRCSHGMHIYYLIRSSQTLYGKFYYYSPFIGDHCFSSYVPCSKSHRQQREILGLEPKILNFIITNFHFLK